LTTPQTCTGPFFLLKRIAPHKQHTLPPSSAISQGEQEHREKTSEPTSTCKKTKPSEIEPHLPRSLRSLPITSLLPAKEKQTSYNTASENLSTHIMQAKSHSSDLLNAANKQLPKRVFCAVKHLPLILEKTDDGTFYDTLAFISIAFALDFAI
jgi:hypothetical protein